MKVVINDCYGGFGLSRQGLTEYYRRKGVDTYFFKQNYGDESEGEYSPLTGEDKESVFDNCFNVPNPNDFLNNDMDRETLNENWKKIHISYYDIERTDPILIEIIEEFGSEKISGECAELKIVEIPDDVEWHIGEYDGNEHIAENHRSWS